LDAITYARRNAAAPHRAQDSGVEEVPREPARQLGPTLSSASQVAECVAYELLRQPSVLRG